MLPIRHAHRKPVSDSRSLPAILAVAALLTAFALPAAAAAQPAFASVEGRTLTVVFQWLDGLLEDLAPVAETPGMTEGPVAATAPLGCEIDPGGTPCPEASSVPSPPELSSGPDPEEPRWR